MPSKGLNQTLLFISILLHPVSKNTQEEEEEDMKDSSVYARKDETKLCVQHPSERMLVKIESLNVMENKMKIDQECI